MFNRIKDEVNLAVNKKLNLLSVNSFKPLSNVNHLQHHAKDCVSNHNDLLIKTLNSEIQFLRDELASKNKIIEMIINDHKNNGINECKGNNVSKDISECVSNNNNDAADKSLCNVSNDYKYNESYDEANNFTQVKKKKSNKRCITIIGDSMLKGFNQYDMSKLMPNKEKIYVKSFAGATIEDMGDYVKPAMKYDPDLFVLHCGTNSLQGDKPPATIAENIIKLARNMKKENNDVIISGLVPRNDKLKVKCLQVNDYLKIKSAQVEIGFMDNSNLNKYSYFNPKGIHLNFKGSEALSRNFINAIKI